MSTLFYPCKCGYEMALECEFSPGRKPRMWAQPCDCDPGEPSELNILSSEECPECGEEINYEKALDLANYLFGMD